MSSSRLTRPRPTIGARAGIPLITFGVLAAAGCATRHPPVLEALSRLEDRTPVVLIPGITGSQLRDRETGKVVWGTAGRFFFPRDGGYSLALPAAADEQDRLEPFAPIVELKLFGIWKFDVYASLLRLMEANGYRLGDLEDPRPGDSFFIFPYDWRHGSADAASELAASLESLRRVRGDAVLSVSLLCHSNAARIARYFVKYGGGSLEEAEAGTAKRPRQVQVDKLILIGTANGGALATFDELHRGRKYVPLVGRRLRPETIFTMWSVYEALPFYHEDLFFDPEGRILDAALSEPEDWPRYGWSMYRPKVRKRMQRSGRTDLFGDENRQTLFLAEALDRARRLHRVLMRDVAQPGQTRYYSVQNDSKPTPKRGLLEPAGERWRTRIELRDAERWPLAHAPGDGHATLESQMWLSPQEHEALAHDPVYVDDRHRKLAVSREAHDWILRFLAE